MKDSKKYSDNLSKLWRKVKPKGKLEKPEYEDPIDAMVYAVILEDFGTGETEKCLKRLKENFVDWNDLRVSRDEEIMEVLGDDNDKNKKLASTLRNCLQAVFEKNDCLKLDYIVELGKRKANDELLDLKVLPGFVEAYVMLLCLDGHCIPISNKMSDFMKLNEVVDNESDISDIRSFVERQVSASENYKFFFTMLELSEKSGKISGGRKNTKKTTRKKTTKKKSTKKSTKKITKKKTAKKKTTKNKKTKKRTKKK